MPKIYMFNRDRNGPESYQCYLNNEHNSPKFLLLISFQKYDNRIETSNQWILVKKHS